MMVAILMICAMAREVVEIPPDQRLLRRNFALGTASIADAYASQNAVWPEALSMVSATGANVPIWSSQVGWHFCVAPGCNLETFFSFAMGNSWATVMFDSPDVAKVALQKLDINYFAIDTNSPFFDLLPYSPLFSSGSLTGRFGLVWSGNGVYLLTWADKNTVPLPAEFQEKYEKSIKSALQFADFPALHGQLAEVYDIWKITRTWPVQLDRSRPHPRGWQ